MDKIQLIRCEYCHLMFEGLAEDTCPKCHNHFLTIVAKYPSFTEEDNETEKAQVR